MYQKILNDPLVFGDDIGQEARSILTGLLTRDPTQRLGVNGAEEIRTHPFFAHHIDFQKLIQKKIQPPFKPSVSSPVVRAFPSAARSCSGNLGAFRAIIRSQVLEQDQPQLRCLCTASDTHLHPCTGRVQLRYCVHDRSATRQRR